MTVQRVASVTSADDTSGLLELTPYGTYGIFLTDTDLNGVFEITMDAVPIGVQTTYQNVFKIINNTGSGVNLYIYDEGNYDNYVTFKDGYTNLESYGRYLYPGNYIYIDIFIDASSLGSCTELVNSFEIVCKQGYQTILTLYRTASIVTEPELHLLTLIDYATSPLQGGVASYYDGTWHQINGSTDSYGELTFEICSDYTEIKMTYNYTTDSQTLAELSSSNYTWQTERATVKLIDHYGYAISGANAYIYLNNNWTSMGATNTSGESYYNVFNVNVNHKIEYNGNYDTMYHDTSSPAVFQTGCAHWSGYSSTPYMIKENYAQSWMYFSQDMELLPGYYDVYYYGGYYGHIYIYAGQVTNFDRYND